MSGRWKIVSIVLVGLAFAMTTGCEPADKFKEVQAAARRANVELRKSQAALETAQQENRTLQAGLAKRRAELEAKDKVVASLQQETDLLNQRMTELKDLLDKVRGRTVPAIGDVRILPEKMDQALRTLADQNPDLMGYLPKYGMIKLKADLTFAKGSAEVSAKAKAIFTKLAEIINADVAKQFHVYVAGHTDDIPLARPETIRAHGTNWGLSAHRALAVVKVLFEAGVEQLRMGAIGFGRHHPVVPNRPGNRGHPLNRRVEIWIVPPDRFLTAPGG
jgi:chemotaxis protein MotB